MQRLLTRKFWILCATLIALGVAPVASFSHALGHLSDGAQAGKHQSHAKSACEGAYANLGHGLTQGPLPQLPPCHRTRICDVRESGVTLACAPVYQERAPPASL